MPQSIDRFHKVATAPEQESKFPVGPESAKKLGYEPAEVDALPSAAIESLRVRYQRGAGGWGVGC